MRSIRRPAPRPGRPRAAAPARRGRADGLCRGDERLAGPEQHARRATRRRPGSSSESTSSSRSSGGEPAPLGDQRPPRRAGARARRGAARPASRSSAGRAVRSAGRCRRGAARGPSFRARGRGRAGPRASRRSAARLRRSAAQPGSPSSLGRCGEERREPAPATSVRASTSSAAERRDLLGPRGDRVAGRIAAGRAPQRRVALRHRRGVLGRQRRACRGEPAEHPVEVRAAHGGAALDHREPVGREDERRRPRCAAARRPAGRRRSRFARFPSPTSNVTSSCKALSPRRPCSAIRAGAFAEADELRVGACPRREALRADVQRLEQVRLAGAVRADDEHEAGLELELEPRVRAEVPKRDSVDDQTVTVLPGSRIGMIRYVGVVARRPRYSRGGAG